MVVTRTDKLKQDCSSPGLNPKDIIMISNSNSNCIKSSLKQHENPNTSINEYFVFNTDNI